MSSITGLSSPSFDIQIISDNICPWCFVGKRSLEAAIKQLPEPTKVSISWNPYFLDKAIPAGGWTIKEYLEKHYGSSEGFEKRAEYLREIGAKAGIKFSSSERRVYPTLDSHCLVDFAKQFNKENEVIEDIFSSYFEQSKDISSSDVLAEIGAKHSLSGVKEHLEKGDGREEVKKRASDLNFRYGRRMNGVPHFIIKRVDRPEEIHLSGAQQPEKFLAVFQKLAETR